jgi:DNA-binding NtrC family response regulator/tetratricopeptide (TPR) repeat protein
VQIVRIVADRFGVASDGRAIDLATGARVVLKIGVGGGAAEQTRWSRWCDELQKMHHPRLATLIDFGALGDTQRFEAWQCTSSRRGASEKTAKSLYALDTSGPETWSPRNCAICTIDRRADAVVADLFASLDGSRPHIISIWGPPGSGRTTAALRAARVARLNGFVPIGVPILDKIDGSLVKNRHLCIISDDDAETRWSALLSVALASPRIHVLLRIGRDELAGVDGVGLERIPENALIDAVRPTGMNRRMLGQVKRAAAMSRGLPARFARLLWRSRDDSDRSGCAHRVPIVSRVAEQPSVYGPDTRHATWPAPGELAALRHRSETAVEQLAKGRHGPGLRLLRQTIGSLSRRGDWSHATGSLLALASALLARGEARGALAALEEARIGAERIQSDTALIDAAALSGHAWIDLARLDDAESVISTAVAVARRIDDKPRGLAASLALGRCLFWKGRYGDAAAVLAPPTDNSAGPSLTVRLTAAAARAAVGLGDIARAMSLARSATQEASRHADPALLARASCAAAFVHLAIGDVDAVAGDVRTSITAARAARDPMRAIRARLLLAESDRRRGQSSSSAPFIKRVRRMNPKHLPPILRARADLLHALADATSPEADTVARHAGRSGLAALSLYVPDASRGQDPRLLMDSSTDGLIGILRLCQTAEDEGRVLATVCAQVRKDLHAASAAVFGVDGSGVSLIAADGARPDPALASRAVTAGITVAPHLWNDRLESAAPVRYGGAVIGALAARWPLGTPYDLSRAAAVLTMAATAAAPVVSAAIERRSRPPAPALIDLLGMTASMDELRRTIVRAAAAPFAILIEGESGSGKELVAKAIHRSGLRRDRPFCTLNCAALPDDLIEAELFGHARGAFTGAVNERPGVFEEAHGGTLFLDEVGELSPRAQAKLLRVIQEGELRRIGENLSRRVDVRIIAATNRDLRHEVGAGRFRLDLLYRLDVIRLVVPPLRDRREDISLLADHFWREAVNRIGSRAVLGAATTAALAQYDWPGNVRELQNVLAALAVRAPRRGVVPPGALPPQFAESRGAEACRLDEARRTFEERFVRAALVRSGGHRGRAAIELGVTRQGLTKLMTRLGIAERP